MTLTTEYSPIHSTSKDCRDVTSNLKKQMNKEAHSDTASLRFFLEDWDLNYRDQMEKVDLFNQELINRWSIHQKQFFIKTLYHQRAHFGDVLWYMGNFAPDRKSKQIILNNIADEFGMNGMSHEMLYLEFSKAMGVDLTHELLDEKEYLPFLREYNQGHLRWLRTHDWNHRLTAFAALERLDNIDYVKLRDVAINIGAANKALVFFNVHIHVTHYEEVEDSFSEVWKHDANVVKKAFNFIGNYQLDIWKRISDAVFSY